MITYPNTPQLFVLDANPSPLPLFVLDANPSPLPLVRFFDERVAYPVRALFFPKFCEVILPLLLYSLTVQVLEGPCALS